MSSGLVLNTNINSLVAQNALSSSGTELSQALEQLSTGLRINTAADDAAGYAIVNGMTSQINGLNQAAQNANDGVSLAQTGSGALSEIVNDLQSMRDLAVESLNATNSSADRDDLNAQFQQLEADINSVASQTDFNGVNLLDGTFQGATFQVGANAGQSITVSSIASAKTSALGTYYTGVLGVAGTLTDPNGNSQTTSAGTAGAYDVDTLAGASGLNTTVDGSSVTLQVEVNGTDYSTGPITLAGSETTDLTSIAAAINQALSPVGGLVATVNSQTDSIQISGTAAAGTGDVLNFSVTGASDAGGNALSSTSLSSNGAAILTALGVDSSDIVGTYTQNATSATDASVATALSTGGTAGAYDATPITSTLAAAAGPALSSANTASVTLTLNVTTDITSTDSDGSPQPPVTTDPITITGTDDLTNIESAIGTALGSGYTVADNGGGEITITGNGKSSDNSTTNISFSIASATDTSGNTMTLSSDQQSALLTDLGVDSEDTVTYGDDGTPTNASNAGKAGVYSGTNLGTDLVAPATSVGSGSPGKVELAVTVDGGTAVNTGYLSLIGTQTTDLNTIEGAINTILGDGSTGMTASTSTDGDSITFGGGTANHTVSFSIVGAEDAAGNAVDLTDDQSASLLTAMGVDTSDTITYTPAASAQPATVKSGTANYVSGLNVQTVDDSNLVLISVDQALQQLATTGADLGAYQNRFQAAVTGLQTDSTNLSSARSQIQDTDYAQATSQLTSAQILQQAGTAMVAQANTIPQNVLTLLAKLT